MQRSEVSWTPSLAQPNPRRRSFGLKHAKRVVTRYLFDGGRDQARPGRQQAQQYLLVFPATLSAGFWRSLPVGWGRAPLWKAPNDSNNPNKF